jgi:site-specific DNA recombinase
MKMAAIYARVSSEQQREENTIASQTAALIEFARTRELEVPKAWIFEDEGFSGATLERPGLERVRDLAAEGQLQAVLVYAPDRLSRKYAYQVLLIEELARQGVEMLFLKGPQNATAEDHLLVQFQGMIAEYERAQILERSRRGKRHRARAGEISVLSGAPYGYRYVRKSDEAPASYALIEAEARVVRHVYELYTVKGLSIGAITRELNDQGVATRKPGARWERSMVWAMLRNPAYRGTACFGKTRTATRQRTTRPLRLRGGVRSRNSANRERPREEWIEIPVPALIAEEAFARAQELLQQNKVLARRRTIEASLVQGLVSCRKCGYALSRTSTRTSARKIHYYRCIGSDAWRHLSGPLCNNKPVRQDLLDQIIWAEVMRLLEDPTLIQQELDRRLAAARAADPTKQREQALERELVRVGKGIERLLTAYQEELLSLEQLRERMPPLRQREQALRAEQQSIADQIRERATCLRLAETLTAFLERLRVAADTLDIAERQRIVRLVIKEVLVGDDTIVIRHCIPVPSGPPHGGGPSSSGPEDPGDGRHYLLRPGRDHTSLGTPQFAALPPSVDHHSRLKPLPKEFEHPTIRYALRHEPHQLLVVDGVEKFLDVDLHHVSVASSAGKADRFQRLGRTALRSKPVRAVFEIRLEDRLEHELRRRLHDAIAHRGDPQRSLRTVRLRDVLAPYRLRPVPSRPKALLQFMEKLRHAFLLDHRQRFAVDAGSPSVHLDPLPRLRQDVTPADPVV